MDSRSSAMSVCDELVSSMVRWLLDTPSTLWAMRTNGSARKAFVTKASVLVPAPDIDCARPLTT